MQLQLANSGLKKKLRNIEAQESTFLSSLEHRAHELSRPLSAFSVKSIQRNPDGTVIKNHAKVDQLVVAATTALRNAGEDVGRLWKEWAATSIELSDAYHDMFPESKEQQPGQPKQGRRNTRGQEKHNDNKSELQQEDVVITKSKKMVLDVIREAEQDVEKLGDAALTLMKAIEKVT